MLALLLGAAAALPPAFLGPDGPMLLGPAVPQAGREGDAVAVVDHLTGRLWVELPLASGERAVWDGTVWSLPGEVDPASPLVDLDDAERVARVELEDDARFQVRYDDAGAIRTLRWPDGATLEVRYDDAGRVTSTERSGGQILRFDWGETLTVQGLWGRAWSIRRLDDEGDSRQGLEVQDGQGRVVRSWSEVGPDGLLRPVEWEDPRGLPTRIQYGENGFVIQDPAARQWRVSTTPAGRVTTIQDPAGGRWQWGYDTAGDLISTMDPVGRSARWERRPDGAVIATSVGGAATRYDRDADGRVSRMSHPNAGTTTLKRDAEGRVVAVRDAVGAEVVIERAPSGRPTALITRMGGRWKLSSDLLGRLTAYVDPTDRVVTLERDSRGSLVAVRDRRYGDVEIRRRADGRVAQVIDQDGRKTGFVRDAGGRLRAVRRPDKTELHIERDLAGEISALILGDQVLRVRRGPSGLPVSAGSVAWTRDAAGRVAGVRSPALSVDLERDASGLITAVVAGGWRLRITRDATGLPVRWEGSDESVVAERDASGRVSRLLVGGLEAGVERDLRGFVDRVVMRAGTWRWDRDAAGLPLRVTGPRGLQHGVDRDVSGRIVMERYPHGVLVTRTFDQAVIHERTQDLDGQSLRQRSLMLDGGRRVRWLQAGDGERTTWRYDANGSLVAVEEGTEAAWSWSPGIVQGPRGELVVLGEDGRASEVRPPDGPSPWGIDAPTVSLQRDELGRVTQVVGEGGSATLTYDLIGRLEAVHTQGMSWRIRYDARGMPWLLSTPGGDAPLFWAPGGMWRPQAGSGEAARHDAGGGEPRGLLFSGGTAPAAWLPGTWGAAGRVTSAGTAALITTADGLPAEVVVEDGLPVALTYTPQGYADSSAAGLVGPAGFIQMMPGGPLVGQAGAVDPLSGERLDGQRPPFWDTPTHRGPGSTFQPLDDAGWAPEGPWSRPIALLLEMGVILPPEDVEMIGGLRPASPLPWLPEGFASAGAPLGPRPGAVDLDVDPLAAMVVSGLRPGGGGFSVDDVVDIMIGDADPRGELPPMVTVPGLGLVWPR